MFLRNSWYVAARSAEVGRKLLGRIVLSEPVVLYRREDGTPVALEDRCAHRHLPLSMGTLVGDTLQCLYHGLRYDKTGTCVRVPGQDTIPRAARVKSYPVVERYHWLWIWMGEAARADPDNIPDFHWLDDPDWGAKGEYLHVKGNWQLVVDNLLDLTHLAFVHGTTIGNPALVEQAQVKVQRTADGVAVTRWIVDAPAPPTFVKAGGFTANVDRWQIINFAPPAFLRLGSWVGGDRDGNPTVTAQTTRDAVAIQSAHVLLAPNRRLLCASPAYLQRQGTPRTPHELAGHNVIAIRQGDEAYGSLRLHSGRKVETVRVRGNLATNDGEIAVNWALGGHGVVLRAEWDIARYLRSGRLKQVLENWQAPPADIHAVYPVRHQGTARVRAFVDHLAQEFGRRFAG